MLAKRIIPCLDVDDGRVVKGIRFVQLRDAGDPVECARRYDEEGADELVFLDITASSSHRRTAAELAARVAEEVFIPFTIGGGIRTLEDVRAILKSGADKISIGSDAVHTVEEYLRTGQASGAVYELAGGVTVQPSTAAVSRIVVPPTAVFTTSQNVLAAGFAAVSHS